jgi:hypothetical protein
MKGRQVTTENEGQSLFVSAVLALQHLTYAVRITIPVAVNLEYSVAFRVAVREYIFPVPTLLRTTVGALHIMTIVIEAFVHYVE